MGKMKKAMERDLEQTKNDLTRGRKGRDLDQDVDDTLKQGLGKEPIPSKSTPSR